MSRQRRNAEWAHDVGLLPWERDEYEEAPHAVPTFHSEEPVIRVLLLDSQGQPLLVEEPRAIGFDPTRVRR